MHVDTGHVFIDLLRRGAAGDRFAILKGKRKGALNRRGFGA